MCEDCEDAEPFYVAYFGKAGGNLWRPPQAPASMAPKETVAVGEPCFSCDPLNSASERKTN
jgi:hypothetical protein